MDGKLFSFIIGAFSSLLWTSLPSIPTIILLLILLCLLAKLNHYLSFLLLGIIWMASVGHWQYSLQLSSTQTSQPLIVVGEVLTVVTPSQLSESQSVRFNLAVTTLDDRPLLFSKTFRLSWRAPSWQIQQGQQVRLLVKVKPPHGLANEAGFHYQQWLFSQSITATGYVKTSDINHLRHAKVSTRQHLLNQLLDYAPEHAPWLAALTFGYRGLLQPEDWKLVQKSGVAHLIAISGLHLAIVASLSYVLLAWLGGLIVSRFDHLHWLNLHKIAMLATIVTTFLYSALAGFGLPTLRAWLMLVLFSLFFLLNSNMGTKRLILFGLSGFILIFPNSLFGISFWLSFFAVSVICFTFWRWPVSHSGFFLTRFFYTMLKLQFCLTIFMLPLIAWQFSYVSVMSVLVNLIAVPVVTFVLVPLCLMAVVMLFIQSTWAESIFSLADSLMDYSLRFLQLSLTPHWAYFELPAFSAWVWFNLWLCVVAWCLPNFWIDKKYLLLLLLPLLSFSLFDGHDDWQIDVLDVGQGVAVLISRNKQMIIYDVGAKYPSGFNMAEAAILPILRARGISAVDTVFISHGDNDHAGSLPELLKGIGVGAVITNQDSCNQDLNMQWQGLNIIAIWPDDAERYSSNNGSCVIKVSDQHHSILLPGDIDKSVERILINTQTADLRANILLAPHHGSNTSSSDSFIRAVGAQYVVFSQGFMNRWDFPRIDVLKRYQAAVPAPTLFSTSEVGQISFRIRHNAKQPIKVTTFRQHRFPFWYANQQ